MSIYQIKKRRRKLMGIYGQFARKLIEQQNRQFIVITLEDSTDEINLSEASVILSKNGKEVELYIRDAHQAGGGVSIPKGKEVSIMNHASSVKLKTPKSITGDRGTPIEIHGNEVIFDEKKYSEFKKIPNNVKKISKKFLEDNLEDLNKLWNNKNSRNDIDVWKNIIDRSYKDIKNIESVSNDIIDYLDTKKGRKN